MLNYNPFHNSFGLEISDLSIKLAQLKPVLTFGEFFSRKDKKEFKIKELRTAKLPNGTIVNGEIEQPELVRKKLLYLLGMDKKNSRFQEIKSNWVAVSLPETKTFLKLIKLNILPNELTEADILFEGQKHLPFKPEDAYIDWRITDTGKKDSQGTKILLATASKKICDTYTYLLESAGLTPIDFEIESLSLARSLLKNNEHFSHKQSVAILDIGATRTNLIICLNNTIQLSTVIPFSGELITLAISQGLKKDYEEAEKIKIKTGAKHSSTYKKYLKIISDLNETLVNNIKETMVSYNNYIKEDSPIGKMIICGGGANWVGLPELLSKKLRIPVSVGDIFTNLPYEKTRRDKKENDTSLAVVMGLALKAIKK